MSQKFCYISGCKIEIELEKTFCQKHWDMVPQALKELVVREWLRPGFIRAIKECKFAVEERIRDSRQFLHE